MKSKVTAKYPMLPQGIKVTVYCDSTELGETTDKLYLMCNRVTTDMRNRDTDERRREVIDLLTK